MESFNKWFWGEFEKSVLEFNLPDNFYGIPPQPPEPEEQPKPKKKKRRKRQKYINRKRRIRK